MLIGFGILNYLCNLGAYKNQVSCGFGLSRHISFSKSLMIFFMGKYLSLLK